MGFSHFVPWAHIWTIRQSKEDDPVLAFPPCEMYFIQSIIHIMLENRTNDLVHCLFEEKRKQNAKIETWTGTTKIVRTTNKDLRSIRMREVPQKKEDREKLLKQNKAEVDESSANIWIK